MNPNFPAVAIVTLNSPKPHAVSLKIEPPARTAIPLNIDSSKIPSTVLVLSAETTRRVEHAFPTIDSSLAHKTSPIRASIVSNDGSDTEDEAESKVKTPIQKVRKSNAGRPSKKPVAGPAWPTLADLSDDEHNDEVMEDTAPSLPFGGKLTSEEADTTGNVPAHWDETMFDRSMALANVRPISSFSTRLLTNRQMFP
jgi:hypothetical protein